MFSFTSIINPANIVSGGDSAMITIWLYIIIVTIAVELATVGLASIWITGGALAALVVAMLHGPVALQIIVFFAVTAILLFFTRPWAIRHVNSRKTPSNYEELIGRDVRVTEKVDNIQETGKALYNGMPWTARAEEEGVTFEVDEIATVVRVEGVKLILKKHSGEKTQ